MPHELDKNKYKILQSVAEDCPVKINVEGFMEINMNWHQEKV